MTKLEDYTSKAPAIIGSSTINHAVRVALLITCSEYCFLDYMQKGDDYLLDQGSIYRNIGFSFGEQEVLIKSLITKGLIRPVLRENGTIVGWDMTDKWNNVFPNLDKEFESFWHDNNGVAWTGTKKKALEYYVKLRKKYSKEFLEKQRDLYFEFLKLEEKGGFNRQKMMCQVFLNPMNERFNEDYEDYCKQKRIKLGIDKLSEVKPLSKEEVLGAYGKDNNK